MIELRPITQKDAFAFVKAHHRHSRVPVGSLWQQAVRVAWRQILKWIQAQLALVETGMVSIQEVMLPYTLVRDGTTLYQQIQTRGWHKGLPAPVEG